MSRLARNVPGYTALGSLEPAALGSDIVINRYQIQADSINEKLISPAAISTSKIQVGAITGTLIQNGAITTQKIAAAAITADRIAAHSITADLLAAGAITADSLGVTELSAISADLGEVNAGSIITGPSGIIIKSSADALTGIFIHDDKIESKVMVDGVPTVTAEWRGSDGILRAHTFELIAEGDSMIATSDSGERVTFSGEGIAAWGAISGRPDFIRIFIPTSAPEIELHQAPEGSNETGAIGFYDRFANKDGAIYAVDDEIYGHSIVINSYPDGNYLNGGALEVGGSGLWTQFAGSMSLSARQGPINLTTNQYSVYLKTDPGADDRIWMQDGRMAAAGVAAVPIIDYDTVASGTGTTATAAVTWTAGNHNGAPTAMFAQTEDALLCCGPYDGTAAGCTVGWYTIDGSSLAVSIPITVIGIWL